MLNKSFQTSILSLSLAFAVTRAATAAPAGTQPPAAGDQQLALANLAYEPLGAGDLVYVSVADCPEATRSYRVSAEGELKPALLNEPLHAAGLLPGELERKIADAMAKAHILVAPSVSVSVLEYRSRPVSVVGAVKHSLTFQALGHVKLLDAIARAEGFAPEAGSEVLVYASGTGYAPQGQQVRHIQIAELLAGTDPSLNIELHGGEEIRVPEAPKLYITGNVKNPGAYPLKDSGDSSVLKALAMCQGLLPYSQRTAYVYRLDAGTEHRREIPVALIDIVKRKAPDIELLPNDILYIQDNSGKRVTAQTLERITSFGSATASGLIIWK